MKLPIVRPYFPAHMGPAIEEVLASGQVTNGAMVRQFEAELATYLGARVVTFCNGQTALLAMLLAHGVVSEDEVIVPSFTFCGTPHAVAMLGAVPMFADIDPVTLTLDPNSVTQQMTERTAAVLGVDVYGLCCDYDLLEQVVSDCDLIFDSAPAFGSMIKEKPTGRNGSAQIFSFHATKPFSTMEGGALVTALDYIADHAAQMRDFGQDQDKVCRRLGLNGKMTEIAAMVGMANLDGWDRRRMDRALSATRLRKKLDSLDRVHTIGHPDSQRPVWTYMPVLAKDNMWRDRLLAKLRARDIEARVYYTACHQLPMYDSGLHLPVTEEIAARIIALPLYDHMTEEEMNYICETLA